MPVAFLFCIRGNLPDLEVLLGPKLDGPPITRGLTVPAGGYRKKDKNLKNTATRELWEEVGILISADRLTEFRIEGGDYWFFLRLNGEKPKEIPEYEDGRPVWGPAQFYPIKELSKLPIARWQKKKLQKAIRIGLEIVRET